MADEDEFRQSIPTLLEQSISQLFHHSMGLNTNVEKCDFSWRDYVELVREYFCWRPKISKLPPHTIQSSHLITQSTPEYIVLDVRNLQKIVLATCCWGVCNCKVRARQRAAIVAHALNQLSGGRGRQFSWKLAIILSQDPKITLVGINPQDAQSYHKDICSTIFIAALLVIAITHLEKNQISLIQRMDKDNVAHLYKGVLLTC